MFETLTHELLDLTANVRGEVAGYFAMVIDCCSCCCSYCSPCK